ncbi:GyrI-like domain-containing protein [Streptomyces sp. TRM 70361]|uniref:GyrI-like domain-containing protein n=1 Tax=Streptomyces sp. TRM 70361 TaxID=3116553 RepID=UPI002E7BBF46|nr:GyrI-like domain-containing protein [Streptomyces sp. TRM 70361]MEE1941665.1 GyrI-like domain-containing protein [Streptomyces sp. TRM 70361]
MTTGRTTRKPAGPAVEERAGRPYVGVRRTVTMDTFAVAGDRLPEIIGWLAERGAAPEGPPFFRYRVIGMAGELEVEAGVPVAAPQPVGGGDGIGAELFNGTLPAGRYAVLTHRGHPGELTGATAGLLDWAARRGLEWDMAETAAGQRWGCRLESYLTDPRVEPDMSRWEVELAFRLAR